jgi:uncharacterized membrane protein
VGIFSFFKKKAIFTAEQQARIVEAIRVAERTTSGEVRVFVERRNYLMSTMDRAREIFFQLKMEETEHRNAVLLYIATEHHELALFADEGIYQATGADYWQAAVKEMIARFNRDDISEGLAHCILQIGKTLQEKFPYESDTDRNELPDEIVFGK